MVIWVNSVKAHDEQLCIEKMEMLETWDTIILPQCTTIWLGRFNRV